MSDDQPDSAQGIEGKIDRRFDGIEAALIEQRQYTEFAYTLLDEKVRRVDEKVRRLDEKVIRLDEKVILLDEKVRRLDEKMSAGFAMLDGKMDAGFGRLEHKLDRFIDVQLHTNRIVERRLNALESPSESGASS